MVGDEADASVLEHPLGGSGAGSDGAGRGYSGATTGSGRFTRGRDGVLRERASDSSTSSSLIRMHRLGGARSGADNEEPVGEACFEVSLRLNTPGNRWALVE